MSDTNRTTVAPSPMSARQVSMLKYIDRRSVDLVALNQANQLTLWSLLHRELIVWRGGRLLVTGEGRKTLDGYRSGTVRRA